MSERGRVTASNGLRMRDSPRDGLTLDVIRAGQEVEVLGRETWLRVQYGNQTGFVLADHVEPAEPAPRPLDQIVEIVEVPPSSVFQGAPLRVDRSFLDHVNAIKELAGDEIRLIITSSLREPFKPVGNAVVPPAKFSNHHVGHAFDMNVLFGGQHLRSTQLAEFNALPQRVKTFLDEIRKQKLRWGGDFVRKDPVHIDDALNHRDPQLFQRKLRALWGPPPT